MLDETSKKERVSNIDFWLPFELTLHVIYEFKKNSSQHKCRLSFKLTLYVRYIFVETPSWSDSLMKPNVLTYISEKNLNLLNELICISVLLKGRPKHNCDTINIA